MSAANLFLTALVALLPGGLSAQVNLPLLPVQWLYSPITGVGNAVYSPDGTKLAVTGSGGLQIYNLSSGAVTCLPTANIRGTASPVFSPDGTKLAVTGAGVVVRGTLEMWDLSTSEVLWSVGASGSDITGLAFSPDGKTLADGMYGEVDLRSVATGALSRRFQSSNEANIGPVAFSPDGKTVADGGQILIPSSGLLELWNVSSGLRTLALPTAAGFVSSIVFSPDGTTIYDGGTVFSQNGSPTGVLETWQAPSGQLIRSQAVSTDISCVAVSPDGKTLSDCGYVTANGAAQGVVELRSAAYGTQLKSLETAVNYVSSTAFSPDGKTLVDGGAVSEGGSSQSGLFERWNVSSGALLAAVDTEAEGCADSVAFSPSDTLFASAGFPNTLQLWDTATGKPARSLRTGASTVSSVAFSPDGKTLADGGEVWTSKGWSGILELWNVSNGLLIASLDTGAAKIASVAFSADGKTLVDGGAGYSPSGQEPGVLEVWSVASAKRVYSLPTEDSYGVNSITLSPDGISLVAGGQSPSGGFLELWNIKTGALLANLKTAVTGDVTSVAFSPNGKTLAVGGFGGEGNASGVLELWTASAGVAPSSPAASIFENDIILVAFSADSKALFVDTSQAIYVVNPSNGDWLGSYAGLYATSLAPSPTGNLLGYSAFNDAILATDPVYGFTPVSRLAVSPVGVIGGAGSTGTVTLSKAAPVGGDIVTLSSSTSAVTVPNFVVVPAGSSAAMFTITTNPVTAITTSTISATSAGGKASASITVEAAAPKSVTVSPTSVVGGSSQTVTGTVTITGPAPAAGYPVSLKGSDPSAAKVPLMVTIPAGQTSATFTVSHAKVTSSMSVTITATLNGSSKTATLTVKP